jgi:hypothetical protein
MCATRRRRSRPLIEEALSATREAKAVDFKEEFDPSDRRSLCETLKDVLAMANSGGGVIVVGVDGQGRPTGGDVGPLLGTDPADLANKLAAFTGRDFDALAVRSHSKGGKLVATVEVGAAPTPLVPVRPGTYERDGGKQDRAFSVGVVYVRHGAKSEPGTSHDLERIIERRLRDVRSFWLKGVRRVAEAPPDSVVTVGPLPVRVVSDAAGAGPVRITTDPNAPAVALANPDKTHPHRLKELLAAVNARLRALGVRVNPYDVRAALAVQGWERDLAYTWKAEHGPRKYSDAFADWLVKEVSKDQRVLRRTRAKWKRMPRPTR